ncbi:transketolase C-terminal domain-containing protein, partial [Sporolactobacillus sp. CQH2019]|uniref:transketolase-like TK C-terminal-containing protein n=1 Tax=Sporolactobacillus sp. CQH2019 TaxID=3023512 RepID=UPI00236835BD
AEGVRRGGYVVSEAAGGRPEGILIATGSEVALAAEAQALLERAGHPVRVVSLPSWDLFRQQPQAYRDRVLPPDVRARVGIEMASPLGWREFVGTAGALVTIGRFGASAPGSRVTAEYGFTPEHVAETMKSLL